MSIQTPEEMVEEARQVLNRRVEELQRQNGIEEHSDLNIGTAIQVIQALDMSGYTRRNLEREQDRELIRSAIWHQASLLVNYRDYNSVEYQRDYNEYGVYVIFELINNREVPLFVEAITRYVGMSSILSSRLKGHANGHFGSNPADHVIREFLLAHATEEERAAYAVASRSEQRGLRRLCMERRGLWVRTTHTADDESARALEAALIRHYESQGIKLWNIIKYPA